MNPAAIRSPRFSCRIVRAWSSLNGHPPAAHCATCPDCQAFFAAGDALESALRREAGAARHTVTPSIGFEQRLARAVHESQPERRATRVPIAAWAGAAVAAAVVVAVVLNRPASSEVASPLPRSEELASAVLGTMTDLSDRWETKVVPATQGVVTNNPLQQELDSMMADGQKAVRFLAANFLPSQRSG